MKLFDQLGLLETGMTNTKIVFEIVTSTETHDNLSKHDVYDLEEYFDRTIHFINMEIKDGYILYTIFLDY